MDNSNKSKRLLLIIELLQTGGYFNATEIANHCQVHPRTVHRYIKTLQENGLRIIYDQQRQGYHLKGNNLLAPMDMSQDEAVSLIILCECLGRVNTGLPFSEPARTAVMKLHNSLPEKLKSYVTAMMEGTSIKVEALAKLTEVRHHYNLLRDALSEKESVRIVYNSFSDQKEITTLLSVYRLLFCKHSWYVIGRSSIHREIRTFNVARLQDVTKVGKKYQIPPRFNVERYLGNAWQMIRSRPYDCKIKLVFSPKVAKNVAEVRWHKTQQTTFLADGSLEFEVQVDGTQEICWWILGYGSEVQVLSPPILREFVRQHAEKMLELNR
jgi:proteasome accessory factor B